MSLAQDQDLLVTPFALEYATIYSLDSGRMTITQECKHWHIPCIKYSI